MKLRVADHAVDLDDLLHHRQPETLGDAALDLPGDRQRVECPTDVLGRGDLHDLDQAQFAIDVDHRTVGDECEGGVTVALAVLVEVLGRWVAVLDGLVDLESGGGLGDRDPQVTGVSTTSVRRSIRRIGSMPCASATASNSRSRTARQAASTAPPLIHVWRDAEVEPAEPTWVSIGSSTTSSTPSIVRAI